ncbi:hypothetical protein [Virgibacillus sp.]|uniref:hypothetical protein n=1 Tax=Virgibacillus sp. TaxID=1872700 RepID=UPI00180C7B0F|nr:hypothetical protein [Virgibacillus sp.]NWO15022.1 hypothetical protein [Virgibacillus sp.]
MQIFIQGNLGNQVKELQKDDHNIIFTPIQSENDLEQSYDPYQQIYIMITDNPLVDFGKTLEKMVLKDNKIFIPIIISFPYLTLGPLSVKGSEGCFHCSIDRLLQHDPSRNLLQDTHQHYNLEENENTVGIHPADTLTISNWINNLKVARDEVVENWKGKISRLNLYDRSLVSSQVIGVSNCEICGIKQDIKKKSYVNMKKYLEEGIFQL